MRLCPVCNESFDDAARFCDVDGSPLLDETDLVRMTLQQATPVAGRAGTSTAMSTVFGAAIGILFGVVLCLFLYILFVAPSQKPESPKRLSAERPQSVPVQTAQIPKGPQTISSPTPEETPVTETEGDAEAAAATPSPVASPVAPAPATFNSGPIATGGKQVVEGQRALIRMKDGSSIEAEAAWEDSQGIWYRRSGLVSFVQRAKVDAIIEVTQPRAATTDVKTP